MSSVYLKILRSNGKPVAIPSGCAFAWDEDNNVIYEENPDGTITQKYFGPEETTGTITYDSQFTTASSLNYVKSGNWVEIRGALLFGSPSGSVISAAVPASIRPQTDVSCVISFYDVSGTAFYDVWAQVKTDGTFIFSSAVTPGITPASGDSFLFTVTYNRSI